jgi:hypothetical protein
MVKYVTEVVALHFQVTPGDVMVPIMQAPKSAQAKGGIKFSERPEEQSTPT